MGCTTAADLESIVALFTAGQPAHDYQPAQDLAELARWADFAAVGTIDAVVSSPRTGRSATTFSVSDVEVFAGVGDVAEFESARFWDGQDPDPLAKPVALNGVRFVAFLEELPGEVTRWAPYVDGVVFGCADTASPLLPFAGSPPDSEGRTFDDFVDLARSAAMTVEGGALDGPVMRYPIRPVSGEGLAALIEGIVEVEGDCLYVAPVEIDDRFPVLWPADTSWDAAKQSVVLPTGVPVALGGAVTGGGGYFGLEFLEQLAGAEAADLAGRCLDNQYGEIAIVNNLKTAIAPG